MTKPVHRLLSVLLFNLLVLTVARAEPSAGEAGADQAEQTLVVVDTGRKAGRVFLDPETGRPGPPPQARRAELSVASRQRLNRSSQGLQPQTLPDGTLLVNLQGRFQNMSVVTLDHNGDHHLTCGHSIEAIEQALEPDASPADGSVGSDP